MRAKLTSAGARKGSLSLVDQAIVSGTNFATSIIIGRVCGPEQLGVYSLVFTLLVLVMAAHQALLMTPYTIYVNRLRGSDQQQYTGSVLVHHSFMSLLAMLGLFVAGLVFSQLIGPAGLDAAVWMLAVGIPFILLRDFGRRFAFAHLQLPTALWLDAGWAALQLAGLIAVAAVGLLTPISAYAILAGVSAVIGLAWLASAREAFHVRRAKLLPQLRQNWSFGCWVFASQITFLVHSYLIHWLLAVAQDTKATGIFMACTMIVYLSNPFIQGVGNFLNPWVARAYAQHGPPSGRRVVAQATFLIGGVMGAFFLVILVLGGLLIRLAYGEEYAGHEATITLLAAGAWVSSLGIAAGHGLWAMERPRANFLASLLGMATTVLSGIWLVGPYGSVGAAGALLAGNAMASMVLFVAFLVSGRRQAPADLPLATIAEGGA